MRDHVVGIDHLDVVVGLDVGGRDRTFALFQGQHRWSRLCSSDDTLEVQQDVDHVFLHAVERRVLMQHAGDLDFGRREAGHRGQQHATQRIAERVAVAALERLHHDLGVEREMLAHR